MRRTAKLVIALLVVLTAPGCRFARSGSQAIDFDPFANPALKVADDFGYDNGTALDQSK